LKTILAGAALLLAISCAALAQTAPEPNPLATRRGFEVGAQLAHYHYEEPNFAQFNGNRGGLVGVYTFPPRWKRVFFRVDGRGSYGSLTYQGSGTQNNVPDSIFETRMVAGVDFFPGSRVSLSPYFGLGYRYLYNDSRGYTQSGGQTFAGYRRYSNYLYAPAGLTIRFDLGNRWVLAPTVEADIFILGKQKSQLSDTNITGLNDVTNTQKRGSGYRGYLMVEKDHLAFGAWMHYWDIKDSDVQFAGVVNGVPVGGLEPANWTREFGIEFRYRF
jgi:hypothetical protein